MHFIKKLRDDRRGIAIELAISVMVVIFALSILLTSVTIMQANRRGAELREIDQKITLEQIGEKYLSAIAAQNLDLLDNDYGEYYVDSKTTQVLVVRKKANDELAFTVELNDVGQITVWTIN